jgi:hypothetical protein
MKAAYWALRRWTFVLRRMAAGDSYLEAHFKWHLLMLEEATVKVFKQGMGKFKTIIKGR